MDIAKDSKTNQKAKLLIETRYLKRKRRNIYVALENHDFLWDEEDALEFDKMWTDGVPFLEICEYFGRSEIELGILILDRAEKGKIKPRKNGLYGG